MRHIGIGLGLGLTLCLANAQTGPDKAEIYRWFDQLNIKAITDAPIVQVTTYFLDQAGKLREQIRFPAFLLNQDRDGFTCLSLNLSQFRYSSRRPSQAGQLAARFRRVDLTHWPALDVRDRFVLDYRYVMVSSFVMARALEARGLSASARPYFQSAFQLSDPGSEDILPQSFQSLQEQVESALFDNATAPISSPDGSLQESQKCLEKFRIQFPNSKRTATVNEMIQTLDRMRKEAAHHRAPGRRASPAERIAELIYQLRFESNPQNYFIASSSPDSPSLQLINLDLQAIPALSDALLDNSFTKQRSFAFNDRSQIIRVGDLAWELIQQISGYSIKAEYSQDWGERQASRKAAVMAWQQAVQEKGLAMILVEGVERGDVDSPAQLNALLIRYPSLAERAIFKGIKNAQELWIRARLISGLSRVDTTSARDGLRNYMANQDDLDCQIAAIRAVMQFDNPAAQTSLIKVVKNLPDKVGSGTWSTLEDCLMAGKDPDVASALAESFPRCSPEVKWDVVRTLFQRSGSKYAYIKPEPEPTADHIVAFNRELRSIIALALTDQNRMIGWGMNNGKIALYDPSLGDVAAAALVTQYPEEFPFDFPQTTVGTENRRLSCLNVIRKERGESPLPLLASPSAPPVSAQAVAPLVREYLNYSTESGRELVREKLLALGPGAAPHIAAEWAHRASTDPQRQVLQELESTVANLVGEVHIEGQTPAGFERSVQAFLALKGKPLTAEAWSAALLANALKSPTAYSFEATAERFQGGNGFTIILKFIPPENAQPGYYTYRIRTLTRSNALANSSGGGSRDSAMLPFHNRDYTFNTKEALLAPSADTVTITASLTYGPKVENK